MFGLGTEELVLILIIVLVLFGGKKLPELSKGVGEVIHQLRKVFADDVENTKNNTSEQKSE